MRVPSGRRTPEQSTPWLVSSRTARSAQGCAAGSAVISAVCMPSRAHAAATLASEPPIWTLSATACSSRSGGGADSRSMTSPRATRSNPMGGRSDGRGQADVHGAPEHERGLYRLEVAGLVEGHVRRLIRAGPGGEARDVNRGAEPARLGIRGDAKAERNELGPIPARGDNGGPPSLPLCAPCYPGGVGT